MAEGFLAFDAYLQLDEVEDEFLEQEEIEEERKFRKMLRDMTDPFSCSETSFRQYFRLSRQFAWDLCDWLRPLPEFQRQRSHGLSVEKQVLTAVRFFATGSNQGVIGTDYNLALSQPSVSRAVTKVAAAISRTLLREFVKFPTTPVERANAKSLFATALRPFEGAIGAIDCTHIAIHTPSEHEDDYVNHHRFYSINVQLVCDPNFKILQVGARYGGTRHDAFIWMMSPLKEHMETMYQNGERHTWLIGDSGYPLEPCLMTPIPEAEPGSPEYMYTLAHCQSRSVIEQCNGILKGTWNCLSRKRVLWYKPAVAGNIINSCVVLHNLRLLYNILPGEDEIELPEEEVIQSAEPEHGRLRLAEARRIRDSLIRRRFT